MLKNAETGGFVSNGEQVWSASIFDFESPDRG